MRVAVCVLLHARPFAAAIPLGEFLGQPVDLVEIARVRSRHVWLLRRVRAARGECAQAYGNVPVPFTRAWPCLPVTNLQVRRAYRRGCLSAVLGRGRSAWRRPPLRSQALARPRRA